MNLINSLLASASTISQKLSLDPDVKKGITQLSTGDGLAYGLLGVGAGIAMIGATGVGIGQGVAAGLASAAVGRNPEAETKIRTQMILGAAIAETSALYSLVIAILLIFVF